MENKFNYINRRDLLRMAQTFGWSAVALAAASLGGHGLRVDRLAHAAQAEHKRRFAKPARRRLVYGVASIGEYVEQIDPIGFTHFVRDIESRTDGELRIELLDQNQVCSQLECAKRARDGIIDLYSATTQNSASALPYLNVLDFPYLFPSRAAQHHFFYHPKSIPLLRAPVRKHYGLIFLFANAHLRGIMLGLKWQDQPNLTRIDQLAGQSIRVTASQFGKIALELLDAKPIPIAWKDTAGALKHGMVDGMESFASAVASDMPDVISQVIDLRLFSGNEHTAINANVFGSLPADLQDAVMESAYQTQMIAQLATEVALFNTVGASRQQRADSIFARSGIRFVTLNPSEMQRAEQICSPRFNPAPWRAWRDKLNQMAGGMDVYQEMHDIAREIPADMLAENVNPRRWWKAGSTLEAS